MDYNEGKVFVAKLIGKMLLAVRRDAATAGTDIEDGDLGALSMDSTGKLWVNAGTVAAELDTGATADLDTGAGTDTVDLIGIALPASGGAVVGGTLTNPIIVGPSTVDDAAFTPAAGTGNVIFAFADESGPDAVDEGDAGAVRMTLQRGLHVNLRTAAGAEIGTVAAPVPVAGTAAHDAAAAGNPVLMGGYASAAAPTGVTDADAVRAWFLANGAQATVLTAGGALIGGDATNGLKTDVTRVPTVAAFYMGQLTVTTSGTELVLASSQALTQGVWVKAMRANTGNMYVGTNPVTTSTGFELDAGESVFIPCNNLNLVYVDGSVNAEKVCYLGY